MREGRDTGLQSWGHFLYTDEKKKNIGLKVQQINRQIDRLMDREVNRYDRNRGIGMNRLKKSV